MPLSSNARIARNSILLYMRMLVSLVISLYTSRAILSILGEDDFGIYNVVGGVVVLFSFLTNAMTSSTQRFLNYNLGLNDVKRVKNVFNTSILAHITISVLVLLLAETLGLWFVMTKLNIPPERYIASLYVYQTSIISTLINIMVVPYRASIIATERMGIFAFISILEVLIKLMIVLSLPFFNVDSLILYSILLSLSSLFILLLYWFICRRKIDFARFNFVWDKDQYREQMTFSGWYLFGGMAMVGSKQGINILINIFYNVAVNAAVGIANQVRGAVYGFVSSFQVAFNPQIVKLYASKEYDRLQTLIYRTSKFSFYLLFVISFPIIIYCEDVLSMWLVDVPNYAVIFTQFVLITSFTEALSAPLWTAIGATGQVKTYQILVSIIILLDIPLVYIILKMGGSPTLAFVINLIVSFCAYVYRLLYIRKYIPYKLLTYLRAVLFPCLIITLLSYPISLILRMYCYSKVNTLVAIVLTILAICFIIIFVGLNKSERNFIVNICLEKIRR